MEHDHKCNLQHGHGSEAFSFMETVVCLSIVALSFAVVTAFSVRFVSDIHLRGTATMLLERLRYAQNLSATSDTAAIVWLDPFGTHYHLTYAGQYMGPYAYTAGISYVDGYLQLPNQDISYDNLGNSQVAGEIMLTDGHNEADIDVYMGVGYQDAGWIDS